MPPELANHARYHIEELLGAGGMGAVYRARHLLMKRTVALKVINRNLVSDTDAVDRFHREMQATRLIHPNIVTAFDAEQAGAAHFLIMEYVEGTSLARLLAQNGPLPVRQACDYIRQAARGLQHAFEQGMVHRDLKPHNLMLTPGGQVKILDFGLARFAVESLSPSAELETRSAEPPEGSESERGLTEVGVVMGTPDYIAPDQARNAHAADIRADIYSLGCTLYELLAGQPPFPEGTSLQKVMAHLQRQPTPLTRVRPEVPAELGRIVERMLAKDPAQRYQTPAEVAVALAPYSGVAGRRRPWMFLAAGVLLAGVLVLAGYLAGWGGRPAVEDSHQEEVHADSPPPPPAPAPGEIRRFKGHTAGVWGVAVSPDGHQALSASHDGTVRLWDLDTGDEKGRLLGHHERVEAVAFLPDGRHALSGGVDKTLRLWDLETGEVRQHLRGHTNFITSVAVSADGLFALSGGVDRTVRLWDLKERKQTRVFKDHEDWSYRVCFSTDGKYILSGGPDGTARLRNWESGEPPVVFHGGNPVWSVALSPDGRTVLAGVGGEWAKGSWFPSKDDNSIHAWDARTGKPLESFKGHTDAVLCLAFSPDGRRLLSAGSDHTIRLWDVESRKELHRFKGHTDRVSAVAFTPDGRRALSGSWDGTVRLWELPE
jgi:hypothetical protein